MRVWGNIAPQLFSSSCSSVGIARLTGLAGVCLLAMIGGVGVSAADGSGLVSAGHWPGYARGGASRVLVVDGHAFVVVGMGGVLIVDVSNPNEPTPLSTIDIVEVGVASDVDVVGSHAFVAFGPGLVIADVSDPRHPSIVGRYKAPQVGSYSTANSVKVVNQLAYVAYGDAGLVILDVHDPSKPALIGSFPASGAIFSALDVVDSVAYVAHDVGLTTLDVSDPTSPKMLGGFNSHGRKFDLVRVMEGRAYLSGVSAWQILDVTNPAQPFPYTAPGVSARDVYKKDGIWYLAAGWDGLLVMDLSQPSAPTTIASYSTTNEVWGIAVDGGLAFLTTGRGLEIVDVSNLAQPLALGKLVTDSFTYGLAVQGSVAYVADSDGLKIVDVSNPASPTLLGVANAQGSPRAVKVAGAFAYVGSWYQGFEVFDVSNPSAPTPVSSLRISAGSFIGLDVGSSGDWVAVANDSYGLEIIDVSDPIHPARRGRISTFGYAASVQLDGRLAFVADANYGVIIFDVSNLDVPVRVGDVRLNSGSLGLRLMEGKLCVGDGRILRIYERSDPTALRHLGSFDTGRVGIYGIEVTNNWAYLSVGDGLMVLDITNPAQIRSLASYNSLGWVTSAAVGGDQVILANGEWGIELLQSIEPLWLRVVGTTPDGFGLEVPRSTTKTTILEAADDLIHWTPILTNAPGASGVRWKDPQFAGKSARFYRLVY